MYLNNYEMHSIVLLSKKIITFVSFLLKSKNLQLFVMARVNISANVHTVVPTS